MIAALMIDPDDSVDFPGNTATALGRPLAAYPFIATRASAQIQRQYVVTASLPVKSVALQNDAVIIDPPPPSDSGNSVFLDMLTHGVRYIRNELKGEADQLELVCVFLSNAPAVTPDLLNAGLDAMLSRPELDAAISVSPHKRWNPYFARRESAQGLLEPYIPGRPTPPTDAWYPDWSLQLLRPRCLDKLDAGLALPWLSGKVLALKQWGGCPVDYQWQVPAVEYWLKKHGFADLTPTFELQPKPQPAPAPRDGRR